MANRLATIEANGRLTVTRAKHGVPWLPAEKGPWKCVVEIKRRGLLRITTLDCWAKEHGMSAPEAEAEIQRLEDELDLEEIPAVVLAEAKRQGGAGSPLFKINLGDVPLWALLSQGEGPMAPNLTRRSVKVLVKSDDNQLYVTSHEAFDLVTRGHLTE